MIYGLVTLFNPELKSIENINNISKQVDKIIICDNSNHNNSNYFSNLDNAFYIFNGDNLGISKAFNVPLKSSNFCFKDSDYLIFFDQDSSIPENYIKKLIQEYEKLSETYDIGCLGPIYFNTSGNRIEIPKAKLKLTETSYSVNSIITSSMLTTFKNVKECGFWNEQVFLDFSDWDLCWRLKKQNKMVIKTTAVTLNHTLGSGEIKLANLRVRYGAPIRDYYQTRDGIYLLRQRYTPMVSKVRLILSLAFKYYSHGFRLTDSDVRRKYLKEGFRDSLRNVSGKYIEK